MAKRTIGSFSRSFPSWFRSERGAASVGAAVVGVLFILRLWLTWRSIGIPLYFYHDSSSHVLHAWWTATGTLNWSWRFFPVLPFMTAAFVKAGVDIFYAPMVLNGFLAAASLGLLYDGVCHLEGRAAAVWAAGLAVSVPTFSRLVFSGQPEMGSLAFLCVGLWFMARGLSFPKNSQTVFDALAVSALGLSASMRSESFAWLIMGGLCLAVKWRRAPRAAAVLGGWVLFWIYLKYPLVLTHALGASVGNAADGALSTAELVRRIPAWFLKNLWPFNLFWLATVIVPFWRSMNIPVKTLAAGVLVQSVLLWVVSGFYMFSWETERNFGAVFFLAMVPAGVVLARWGRISRRSGKAILSFLAFVVLASSWYTSLSKRSDFAEKSTARALGWLLRQTSFFRSDAAGDSFVLLEVTQSDWPNTLVFSGRPDRFRLIPTVDVEWGAGRVWRGESRVAAVAVMSEKVTRRLQKHFQFLEPLATMNDGYRVFPVEPIP